MDDGFDCEEDELSLFIGESMKILEMDQQEMEKMEQVGANTPTQSPADQKRKRPKKSHRVTHDSSDEESLEP